MPNLATILTRFKKTSVGPILRSSQVWRIFITSGSHGEGNKQIKTDKDKFYFTRLWNKKFSA